MAEQNKRNLVKMLLLGFVTLGIYWLYWIYKVTQLSNHVKTLPERSPVAQLFLCMLVPFYDIYWYYQTSKRVDVMMASAGQESDSGILTILLMFFGGRFTTSLYLQDKINTALGLRTGEKVDGNISGALALGIALVILSVGIIALSALNVIRSIEQHPEAFQQGYDFGYNLVTGGLPEEENNEIELDAEESVRQTKDGRWALMKGDKVEEDFTGVAENEQGLWYIVDGYVDFDFYGTVDSGDGTLYSIENGKVVSEEHTND